MFGISQDITKMEVKEDTQHLNLFHCANVQSKAAALMEDWFWISFLAQAQQW
jgi:hypothetical protein